MRMRILVLTLAFATSVGAIPLGTEFTYQGVLSDGGSPAAGTYDFRFILYDADAGGSQVGVLVFVEDLAISDGRVTTQLDFGSVFDGTALWLEVSVRDGVSTGTYAVLSPRQELTAAPFSQHALSADVATTAIHATTADDSDLLDGQDGLFFLSWSNFTGVPHGLDDGDDDTLADLDCASDEIARWNGSAWSCSGDDDTPYVRTVVVGPVGNTYQNGTALRNAINAITPPANQGLAVLLVLEPGVYNVGTDALPIWNWMTIEGAGENLTRITGAVCDATINNGTIRSTSTRVGLRHLTVENTCSDPSSNSVAFDFEGDQATAEHVTFTVSSTAQRNTAVYNSGDDLSMRHVTLGATSGTQSNKGLVNTGASTELFDISVHAGSGEITWGIGNSGAGFSLQHGTVKVFAGTNDCTAFFNDAMPFDGPTLTNVTLESTCIAATASNKGLYLTSAPARLTNVRASGDTAISLHNTSSHRSIRMVNVTTFGGEYGVWCQDEGGNGLSLYIDDSLHAGGTDAVHNLLDQCSVRIGSTHLNGGVTGLATCAGVYDGSYTFFASTCP